MKSILLAMVMAMMSAATGCAERGLEIASTSAAPLAMDILESRCSACHSTLPTKAAFDLADADGRKDDIVAVVTASDGHHPRVFVDSDEVDALLLWAASR